MLKGKLNKYSKSESCENYMGADVNPEIWPK